MNSYSQLQLYFQLNLDVSLFYLNLSFEMFDSTNEIILALSACFCLFLSLRFAIILLSFRFRLLFSLASSFLIRWIDCKSFNHFCLKTYFHFIFQLIFSSFFYHLCLWEFLFLLIMEILIFKKLSLLCSDLSLHFRIENGHSTYYFKF